jgi:hypothetical protein
MHATDTIKTYGVLLDRIAVMVRTDNTIETFEFRAKRHADKKILELIRAGYTFDRMLVYGTPAPATTGGASGG